MPVKGTKKIDFILAFAECAGTLDGPEFSPEWESMMSGVTEAVPLAKAIPGIVQVMQNLPLKVIRLMDPLMGSFFDYQAVGRYSSPMRWHQ